MRNFDITGASWVAHIHAKILFLNKQENKIQ